MRTIKFLGFAVALAAVAVPAFAQGGLQPGAFPGIDNLARREAQRIEHQQQMRRFAGQRAGRMGMAQGLGQARGFRGGLAGQQGLGAGRGFAAGPRQGFRAGARAGVRAGARQGFAAGKRAGLRAGGRGGFAAGNRAGLRAGGRAGFGAGNRAALRANATPEQKAFVEQFRTQRETVRAQVVEGKLTREQARAQMQKWATEHRPKK
ncbi:MAG: hypothetical protein WC700_20590 [Gemmatimonadaceae bacterium]